MQFYVLPYGNTMFYYFQDIITKYSINFNKILISYEIATPGNELRKTQNIKKERIKISE